MRYLRSFRLYESDENGLEKEFLSYYGDIVEILDDWSGYDFKFQNYDFYTGSSVIIISPKGYPDSHRNIYPVHIDKDVLECFKTLNYFMELNFGLVYSHSYYFCDHNYHEIGGSDIFTSEGKLVTMVQLFYKSKKNYSGK